MFLLHQIVPHLHHQHEDTQFHESISQTDSHDHHHNIPKKEGNSKSSFLDLFLAMHVHVAVSDEIPVIRQLTKKLKEVDNVIFDIPASYNNIFFKYYTWVEKPAVYHPPNNYFNSYLSSLDSRGPPSLG